MIEATFSVGLNKRIQIYGLISYFSDDKKKLRLKFTVKSKNY